MLIRKIQPADDAVVADLIRCVMQEFGACGAGYSVQDPEVDAMSDAYDPPDSVYYVVVDGDEIIGCGGIAPLVGGDPGVCELRKMYFLPRARGKGIGRVLAETLLVDAVRLGYKTVYLETLRRMESARRLYERLGFQPLDAPLGQTGHDSCDAYYALELAPSMEIALEPGAELEF